VGARGKERKKAKTQREGRRKVVFMGEAKVDNWKKSGLLSTSKGESTGWGEKLEIRRGGGINPKTGKGGGRTEGSSRYVT